VTAFDHSGARSPAHMDFLREYANWERVNRLHITFDVDWAPDYMIQHALDILQPYDVGVTFFATHETPLLKKIAAEGRHEVGVHPNLAPESSQGKGFDAVFRSLASWYPGAIGCRFHVLDFSYRDLKRLPERGIRYDVSRLMYNISHLQPAYHRDLDLILLPYMWEDGICENARDEVSTESMRLDAPGLKVLNFHPMNVFLNVPNADVRLDFKKDLGSVAIANCPEERARRHRVEGDTGAQRALEGLLARIKRDGLIVRPLRDLYKAFAAVSGKEASCD